MQSASLSRKLTGTAVAIILGISPTMANAATAVPIQSISPLVALSAFGSQASVEALCGSVAATAATGAAAAATQAPGCVLPVTDAPAPPPPVSVAPPPPPPGRDFGISPILLGLGALILVGAVLAAMADDDDDGRVFPPVSPA